MNISTFTMTIKLFSFGSVLLRFNKRHILYGGCLFMSKTKSLIYLMLLEMLLSPISFAQNLATNNSNSYSIGGLKSNLSVNELKKVASIERTKSMSEKMSLQGMDRQKVKKHRQLEAKQWPTTLLSKNGIEASKTSHHGFSIYSAYSQLISDIDEDGYYQTFSVSFDADISSSVAHEQALVYADLYLSQNGGPWILYFSTDSFFITGEDTQDEFEVVTQLDSGYLTEHYDVLIDLYEVGYSDVVATYSANDSNTLYALPLESADYDPEYIEVVHYDDHGGSSSWLLIIGLLLLYFRRN
jgi:hypothetical protein